MWPIRRASDGEGGMRMCRNGVVRVFVADLASGMKTGEVRNGSASSADDAAGSASGVAAWRSLREPSLRLLTWTMTLSALAHVAFTPLAGLLGLMAWLFVPATEPELEAEQLRSIPITMLSDEELAEIEAARAPPPEVPAVPQPSEPASPAPKPAPPAAKPTAPAAPAQKPTPPARPKADGVGHPVAMSGVSSEVVDSNANVNLLLLTERIRRHPLGPRIGKLIVNFPQWSSFFESGEIDPVRDINRILVVGPQFRRSADVVAILEHGMPAPIVRAAVDRLVQRPPRGRWLKSKMPAARAHADRAERLFVLSAPNVLVVAPPHLERQLLAAPPTGFPSPEGDAALVAHIKTPWRALMGLPFRLPESIAWLRLDVVPLEDGGAQVRISAEDADARQAAEHAQSLSVALNALTNPDLGALGALVGLRSIAFVDKIQFQARNERITGQVRVSPRQLDRLLTYTEELVMSWTGRRSDAPPGVGPGPRGPASRRPAADGRLSPPPRP